MTNVIAAFGAPLPNQPSPDIVGLIETLLERARSGEVVAMAFAATLQHGAASSGWASNAGQKWSLGGAIMMLQARYQISITRDD